MPEAQTELRTKRKSSIKALIRNAASGPSLEPFVEASLPAPLVKHVLRKVGVGREGMVCGVEGGGGGLRCVKVC